MTKTVPRMQDNNFREADFNHRELHPRRIIWRVKDSRMYVYMKNTIATYLEGNFYYTTFMRLIKFSELYPILHEGTNLTVFALPNSAFEKMGERSYQELINLNRLTIKNALTYHIVGSGYQASRLIDGARIQTLNGELINIYHREGVLKINNSLVIRPNKRFQNGVVHIIDSMLQAFSTPVESPQA